MRTARVGSFVRIALVCGLALIADRSLVTAYDCTPEGCFCADRADCEQAVKDGKCKTIKCEQGNCMCV
jgi:hypothetical protein